MCWSYLESPGPARRLQCSSSGPHWSAWGQEVVVKMRGLFRFRLTPGETLQSDDQRTWTWVKIQRVKLKMSFLAVVSAANF